MTEVVSTVAKVRMVDIDSAIGHSSFQLPVFVALGVEGGEAQVVKTFSTARDVFDHVFSVMLDRLRQPRAVAKVENLVPASANLKNSENTEYVLFVRGRAIFWFGSAAAKRAAGRRLLLEHARALADAEQAPFYVLGTRARRIRAAVIALGLVVGTVLAVLLYWLAVHREFPIQRPVAWQTVPSRNRSPDVEVSASDVDKFELRNNHEEIPDFNVEFGGALPNEAFPVPAIGPAIPFRRPLATSTWLRGVTRTSEHYYVRRPKISAGSLPLMKVREGIREPISRTSQISPVAPAPTTAKAGALPTPPASPTTAPTSSPATGVIIPVK